MIQRINTEDSFAAWLDQLPYPLASTLWLYHAQNRTEVEQCQQLLKFFEALAQFLCIVHMSALYPTTSNLWQRFPRTSNWWPLWPSFRQNWRIWSVT